LKNISMPLLNVMAKFDHLVPNDASKPLNDAVSSKDQKTLVFSTGHIGIFVGSKSQKEVCPRITEWLKPRSLPDATRGKKSAQVTEAKLKQRKLPRKIHLVNSNSRRKNAASIAGLCAKLGQVTG